ncbi:MBL fold metallo-hydrolase [Planotetraspora phitsanulokensis]|uniref:MBL fold metallo-hydrolase n=1 Tax=Planotetraspora phitsanulokensis TaxID=575192 RepID=A0A8J3TZF3_9ACTN|nr:MBL fold metallo-hydrolase [Planotetraspora phitsanulokensis]GII35545.1 MBL fold metallo-hydrolase [Planotetraspora phitsanulokensis]
MLASLDFATYVSPPKPVVSDDLAPGAAERLWSPTTSTLIYGERDAVLVDPLLTVDEARHLVHWITSAGRKLTTVFVTHGHGDHFFGASVVLERFPEARFMATAGVVGRMRGQLSPEVLDGFWRPRFPGRLPERLIVAEPLDGDSFELEGHDLVAVELGHSDTDDTTALHVPSLGLVVAGDAVYNDVHLYLVESGRDGRRAWMAALDTVESLRPETVIAGHKRASAGDGPHTIDETRRYIRDFDVAVDTTDTAVELYETMLARHPGRVNVGVLWNSARAAKG